MIIEKGWFRFLISVCMVSSLSLSGCSQTPKKSLVTSNDNNSASKIIDNHLSPPKPTQVSIPTSPPTAKCPVPNIQATMFEAKTGDDAENFIFDYLNQGGSSEKLQKEIIKLGPIVNSSQVFIVDSNDDGVQEIVVAINFAPPQGQGWEDTYENLSIYSCINGAYEVTNIIKEKQEKIRVLAVANLLGLEVPEILVSRQWFFIGGCREFVEMYSLEKQSWVSSFKTDDSPCEMKTELRNGKNGHKELVIQGHRGCSYMACGPARARSWTYEFGGNEVKLINDELFPSPYRIHGLEDGEIAMGKGDLQAAIRIYNKTARDNNLIDTLTITEQDSQFSKNIPLEKLQQTAHAYQTSFAYFREFVLLLYLDRNDEADRVFEQIKIVYPEGENGSEFIDISSYLRNHVKSGLSVYDACELTNQYIADEYILGPKDFIYPHLNGWGDFSLQIGELLCPTINIK